jgi:hypothetical protein
MKLFLEHLLVHELIGDASGCSVEQGGVGYYRCLKDGATSDVIAIVVGSVLAVALGSTENHFWVNEDNRSKPFLVEVKRACNET